MKKIVVAVALIVFIAGFFVAFSTSVQYVEEVVVYDWNPITPQTLEPTSSTGLAFISITKTQDVVRKFPNLRNVTALELNIATSPKPVRVIIGKLINPDPIHYDNIIFNSLSTTFSEKIPTKGTVADFLEIRNEGNEPVNVSGNVKVIGEIVQNRHPYLSLGTMIVMVGLALIIYGIATKPKRRTKKVLGSKTCYIKYLNLNKTDKL